jgi:hypothetical protein
MNAYVKNTKKKSNKGHTIVSQISGRTTQSQNRQKKRNNK